jgi:hypothetical protein
MRLKEFAHGFDLSGSADRFFRKGSFGKDEEQNYRPCAPSINCMNRRCRSAISDFPPKIGGQKQLGNVLCFEADLDHQAQKSRSRFWNTRSALSPPPHFTLIRMDELRKTAQRKFGVVECVKELPRAHRSWGHSVPSQHLRP